MRTDPVALFLFAHQDDEFGVYHAIDLCIARGQRVACAYLTRGDPRRNGESVAVLTAMGVARADIVFAGDALAIDDGSLPAHLAQAGEWIGAWFDSFNAIGEVCVTAWEGGHHDHDALHALAVRAADSRALLPRLRQYSLYNGHRLPGALFRVLSPLAANGPASAAPIPWPSRVRHLRQCLRYPSQRKTWIGLFPFVLLYYLLQGAQRLQPVSMARLEERPHAGPLFYERRFGFSWERMRARLAGQ
ncbi:MAG TPA: PIG-L family deacetylase [Telluria sp.]|nr:PIG-L family deacetylase [Telluria sp.]